MASWMQSKSSAASGRAQNGACFVLVLVGILLISAVDCFGDSELRLFPLFYLPIALAAWQFGWVGALSAATLSTIGWSHSNEFADLPFSRHTFSVANGLVQGTSFAIVGLLVTALRSSISRERALSRMDFLCPLLNRRAFFEDSVRLLDLCRRHKRPVTLAYLDMDNFKGVNDLRGHKAGDELLLAVAQVLIASIRTSDVAARLGGDEFVIMLPEVGPQQAQSVLERLRGAISHSSPDHTCPVSVSVGAVTFMTAPDDLDSMLQMADSVMYAAKNDGKNRVYHHVIDADGAIAPLAMAPGSASGSAPARLL